MTILGSLGANTTPASQNGDSADVTLSPNAETLALFASLFALIQPQSDADDLKAEETPATLDNGSDPAPIGKAPSANQDALATLPAAAMLMAATDQPEIPATDDRDLADMAPLAHLLTVAKAMSGSDGNIQNTAPSNTVDGVDEPAPGVTTAKAILARAIRILDDIENPVPATDTGFAQVASADSQAGSQDMFLAEADILLPDVPMAVSAAPSPEFVGPMPMVPVRMVAEAAPSPEFVGPMPVVPVRMVAEVAPSPEFVGPMPAGPVRMVAEAAPSPEFVGPMPVVPVRMVAEAAPSPEFVGPMPAKPVQLVAEAPKSADPSRTAPVLTADSAPRPQMTSGSMPSQPAVLSNEVSRPGVPVEGFAKAVDQDDTMTSAEPRSDRQTSLKDRFDQANQRMMVKPEIGYEKVSRMPSSPGSEATQAPILSAREMRATMDQPAANNGQSSSATSTSVSNATTAGGQSGSQGQSGQGGGQSASQFAADFASSRDVADRAMLHRLNTANAGWSETMIKRLTSDLRAGVQSVRIILEPRNLGRLNVDLGLRDGKASIRIAAETVEAASLLAGARGQLSQMLEQSGMRLAGFQSSAGGQDAQADTGAGQQGHAQHESGGKNTGRNGNFSNKLENVEDRLGQDDGVEQEHDLALLTGETAVLSKFAADFASSRDVADRAMLHRLNTANAGWSETMIKRLTSDLRAGVQSVRIILEPRNLGRLNVDLGLRDGKASIRIAAETVEAASLLAGARGQLSQMLEQSGMRLAGFQSSAGGQDAQADTGAGQQGHAQHESGGKNTGRNGNFSNKLENVEDRLGQDDGVEQEHDLALRTGETAVLSILA